MPSTSSISQEVFELYKKYQIKVHKDPPEKPTFKQFERFLVKSPIKVIKTKSFVSAEISGRTQRCFSGNFEYFV